MKFRWEIEEGDVIRIRAFLEKYQDDPFVKARIRTNIAEDKDLPTRTEVWWAFVACRVTSQQRSGPNSPVTRLITKKPFPLGLDQVEVQQSRKPFIEGVLRGHGGIRFAAAIAGDLSTNLRRLEDGQWEVLLGLLEGLRQPHEAIQEREVADYLASTFAGVGPKQSRNLIQTVGLSLYEIPIDSRITKWLNEFGFPVHLTGGALGERAYYEFVSDGIQALCRACEIYPCVLDAAIFTSFDKGGWTEDKIVW